MRLTDDQWRDLLRRAHVHHDGCYGRYEPCGEHHAHDDECGARPLCCGLREDAPLVVALDELRELRERRADALTDEEREALTTARDVCSDSDVLDWDSYDQKNRAIAVLDRVLREAT